MKEESKLTRSTQQKSAKQTWKVANTALAAKKSRGIICYMYNQPGHISRECNLPANVRCHHCGRGGHISRDCHGQLHGGQQSGAPQQEAGCNEQLSPPPKKQDVGGRAFVVGDHDGGEPIAGMFHAPT